MTAELAALADEIDARLDNEHTDRQLICEDIATHLRRLAKAVAPPPVADKRVIYAREFLDAIRPYKVADRPHSVLTREDAELRRMLAGVLAVIDERQAAAVAERGTILAALDTAAEYLEYRASLTCPDCAESPAELCETHANDLEAAAAYRAVARQLGEVGGIR